jgi:hypothetical protein
MGRSGRWTPALAALAAAAMVLGACARPLARPKPSVSWRWAYSTGGIAGRRLTPESEHLQVVYMFGGDSLLLVARTPGGTDSTHYHITQGGGTAGRDLIHYKRGINVLPPFDTLQYLRKVGRDTLILSDRCADCYEHTFVRFRY